jgi:threonine dehydratase
MILEHFLTPMTKTSTPASSGLAAPARPAARPLSPADYLKKILTARVYDVAVESALESARNLSARLGHTVLLKREDQQRCSASNCAGLTTKWRT